MKEPNNKATVIFWVLRKGPLSCLFKACDVSLIHTPSKRLRLKDPSILYFVCIESLKFLFPLLVITMAGNGVCFCFILFN